MKRFACIALAIAMVFVMVISASADEYTSPQGKQYFKIEVSADEGGTATSTDVKVEKNTDGTVTLTATPTDGIFDRWIIEGDYEILDGMTLTDPVITIRPNSDINAIAHFKKEEAPTEEPSATPQPTPTEAPTTAPQPKPNDDSTAPRTGDPLPYALSIMLLAFCAAVVAAKKLKKD